MLSSTGTDYPTEPAVFIAIYVLGVLVGSTIRWYYTRAYRKHIREEGKRPKVDTRLVYLPFLGMVGLPTVYILTSLLSVADYTLPLWAGWAGTAMYAGAFVLLWRSHADLDRAFSPITEITPGQQLVTEGVYRFIRHPMYAAHLLWALAQPLLLWNWVAGFSMLITFLPLYLVRVPREEAMMEAAFGDKYRVYSRQTGRIIPRLFRRQE